MRNIFLFIRRYFTFLLFVVLQIISIYFIVSYSKYHHAAFGHSANQVTGKINQKYNNIQYYFHLRKTNDSLLQANENLYNKLRINFDLPDSVTRSFIDSIQVDSLNRFRTFKFKRAKVVANSVTAPNNFIILSKGSADGFHKGMGIIDEDNSIVGIVTEVSEGFSVVMSLMHKDSKISGKLQKTGETGTVSWDGTTPNIITMTGVPKSVKVAKGDSVITSGFSTSFPKGMMIGRIEAAYADPSSSTLRIRIRSAADFYNLQFAYGIDNMQAEEINRLLNKARKQE